MNLDEIRSELEDTDRQLLRCVARRQSLAAEIGRVKQSSGVPTRDYGQERDRVASGGEGSERPNLCTRAQPTMLRCR